jgi:hypothetical protein
MKKNKQPKPPKPPKNPPQRPSIVLVDESYDFFEPIKLIFKKKR